MYDTGWKKSKSNWRYNHRSKWLRVVDHTSGKMIGWMCEHCQGVNDNLPFGRTPYCPFCGAEMIDIHPPDNSTVYM